MEHALVFSLDNRQTFFSRRRPLSHTVDITLPLCGEHQLLLAVLHRSLHDLTPHAPALDRRASVAFFSHADGWLEALCDMAGLEHTRAQALARSRYPDGG